MLRLYFIVIVVVGLSGFLKAQDYIPLVLNPKVGVNFSDLVDFDNEQVSSSATMGWNVGIDARYGTNFLLKGGIHFYKTGSAWRAQDSTSQSMHKFAAHQLKLPIGAGIKVLRVDYFNLWLLADGILNYTIDVRNRTEKDYIDFNKTGLSGRLGIGMDLSRFTMELTIEHSFSELIPDLSAGSRLVNLSVGIKL